jgi:sugar phosphate isomerase/epimerase
VGFVRKLLGPRLSDRRRLWSDVTYALRQCADYAAERGVVLAIQNDRQAGVVGSAQQLEQCVHDVGSPWLRICLDPADLADRAGIDTALSRTVQVHARLQAIGEDGSDGTIHWPELLRALKLNRYRGFVLMDYRGAEDPSSALQRATLYLRGVLHLLQRQQLLAAGTSDGASPITQAERRAPSAAEQAEVHAVR